MAVNGVLTVKTVNDLALVGTHVVKFEAFLNKLDPSGLHPYEISFTSTIKIEAPAEDISSIFGSLMVREQPVVRDSIAPSYIAYFDDETTILKFDFADKLALAHEAGENPVIEGLVAEGIRIKMIENSLPTVVSLSQVDYSEGKGFGTATL